MLPIVYSTLLFNLNNISTSFVFLRQQCLISTALSIKYVVHIIYLCINISSTFSSYIIEQYRKIKLRGTVTFMLKLEYKRNLIRYVSKTPCNILVKY